MRVMTFEFPVRRNNCTRAGTSAINPCAIELEGLRAALVYHEGVCEETDMELLFDRIHGIS